MLHWQYHGPQILKYVWDPERNLGLGPSQIHQDHATQCQEECRDSQEVCHDGQEVCCDSLELEQDHGKFWAVGDYHCHASLGKPDSAECGFPSCPYTCFSDYNIGNVFDTFLLALMIRSPFIDAINFFSTHCLYSSILVLHT